MNKRMTIAATAAACLFAQAVCASGGFEGDFQAIDRDGDGALSWTEFKSRVMEILYFADLDNDGSLSTSEAPADVSRHWQEIDRDGDGQASSSEFVAFHKSWFQRADADRSGSLSLAETRTE